MQRIWTSELPAHAGERVLLAGWLHRLRRLSGVDFLILRDGRGTAQVVLEQPELRQRMASLPAETVITLQGEAVSVAQAPGGVEVHAPCIEVLSVPAAPPPFELHRPAVSAQLPTLLDHAAVALRHPRRRAVAHLASASTDGFRRALRAEGFIEIHTPKLVQAATESGASVFSVDYFGRLAFLAQSPQLFKQICVGAFERVYEVGPAFRAEPHDTPRHLNEFTSLDAEMGFIEDHRTVMAVLRRVIASMSCALAEEPEALALLGVSPPGVPDEIPAIHFADAQQLVERATGERVVGGPDLAPAHERWLGDWARREHGSELLFVTGYPMAKRPFYTHPEPGRPEFSNSFDLLLGGQELVTGGQRLHRYEDYVSALAAQGTSSAGLEGYLEAFRHGMPPHGGFAIGLERWVARIANLPNLREVALFPRDMHRLSP